jgi:hypothetical protein
VPDNEVSDSGGAEAVAQILAEVREILAQAGPTVTVTQNVKAGRDVYNAGGNMNITR